MEEKELILDEVVTHMEETKENSGTEDLPKNLKTASKNNGFKQKECKVISYNKHLYTLDINFDGYGVRLTNVKDFDGDIVTVKYKGEIGKPNFVCRL